jgi:hypothetical protein
MRVGETVECTLELLPARPGGAGYARGVAGTVTSKVDGQPIPGMRVSSGSAAVATGPDGRYFVPFDALDAGGGVTVTVTDPAGGHEVSSATFAGVSGWGPKEWRRHDVGLSPRANAVLTGRVLDSATGEPVGGAEVFAGGRYAKTTQTDEQGSYRLDLVAGQYQLDARAACYLPTEPVPVDVPPGPPTTHDLTLDAICGPRANPPPLAA